MAGRGERSWWSWGAAVLLGIVGAVVASQQPRAFSTLGVAGVGAVLLASVCLIPALRRRACRGVRRWDALAGRHTAGAATAVGLLSAAALAATAFIQGQAFGELWHDEFSYATQTQMLLTGRLWMPAHPQGEAFGSFYLITSPVYASIYFPGTSMAHAPAQFMALPYEITSLALSGLAVGLVFYLATRIAGGGMGLVAAVCLLSVSMFRMLSFMVMSQTVTLALSLVVLLGWWRWRHRGHLGWAALMGAAGGWLVLTRPIDAACVVLPVAAAMLFLDTKRLGAVSVGQAVAVATLAASPFFAVQLVTNQGITGSWSTYPHAMWVDRHFPDAGFGFHAVTDRSSASEVPQVRRFYETTVRRQVAEHTPERIADLWIGRRGVVTMRAWFGSPWLLVVALPAVLLLRRPWLWPCVLPGVLFVVFYTWSCFYLPYYPVSVGFVPAFAVVLGIGVWAGGMRCRPSRKTSGGAAIASVAAVLLTTSAWPGIHPRPSDAYFVPQDLLAINQWVDESIEGRALVLFRDGGGVPDSEPVYNADVAWPDDARVVRVHDRGPRNLETLAYYAANQPDREVYLLDRGNGSIARLGRVTHAYRAMLNHAPLKPPSSPSPPVTTPGD